MKQTKNRAILFLLIFTPFFAESIASTNTPWFRFLNLGVFLFMVSLYGTAALVLRELCVRKKVGFGRFLMYGTMFASLNEGIVANTWFKVNALSFNSQELVRIAGTNWHLVVNLIIFHTLFSMLIPILLSFTLFPQLNQVKLLKNKWMLICVGLLLLMAFGSLIPKHHMMVVDFKHRLALMIVIIFAALLYIIIPHYQSQHKPTETYSFKKMLLIGAGFSLMFTISYFFLPKAIPGASILFSLTLYIGSTFLAYRISKNASYELWSVLPIIIGLMFPIFALSFIKIGILQPVISGLFLIYIYWLYRNRQNSLA